jgi:hypothetical protein
MADLFSAEWMGKFVDVWNASEEVSGGLAKIGFDSTMGCGFKGDDTATGVLVVEKGIATLGGAYDGQNLDWDLRADKATWEKWAAKGIGMTGLGIAVTSGKLKFATGDYGAMIKNPGMAGPFVKVFGLMGKVS